MYCEVGTIETCGAISNYDVFEDILIEETIRTARFKVCLVKKDAEGECDVKCNCRLFEFRGILCKHAIAVLVKEKIFAIPAKYILRRWRKDIKRRHTKVRVNYSDWSISEEGRRYDKMCSAFFEVADLAYEFEDKCNLVNERIVALKEELSNDEKFGDSSKHLPHSGSNNVCKEVSTDSRIIHSPVAVRCKGRTPATRMKSKVEQAVTRKRKNSLSKELKEKSASSEKEKSISSRRGRKKVTSSMSQEVKDPHIINNKLIPPSNVREQYNISETQESIIVQETRIPQDIIGCDYDLHPSVMPLCSEFHQGDAGLGKAPVYGNNFNVTSNGTLFLPPRIEELNYNFTEELHHPFQMQDGGQ